MSRIERRQAATKQKVIHATMRLIAEQGYDATTMEQIAEEADIAKGTLYNHFPVKEAIISAFVQQKLKEDLADRLRQLQELPDTRSRMVFVFKELFAGVQRQQELFEKFLVYRMQQMASLRWREEQSDLSSLSGQIIQLGQQAGEIRKDIPIFILTELFEFVFVEIVKQFYLNPDTFDTDIVIERCVDLFMNGAQPQV